MRIGRSATGILDRLKPAPKMSQTAQILKHLKRCGKISNTQMWNMHIQRGSERIRELKSEGHVIRSIHVKGPEWVYVYDGEAE